MFKRSKFLLQKAKYFQKKNYIDIFNNVYFFVFEDLFLTYSDGVLLKSFLKKFNLVYLLITNEIKKVFNKVVCQLLVNDSFFFILIKKNHFFVDFGILYDLIILNDRINYINILNKKYINKMKTLSVKLKFIYLYILDYLMVREYVMSMFLFFYKNKNLFFYKFFYYLIYYLLSTYKFLVVNEYFKSIN